MVLIAAFVRCGDCSFESVKIPLSIYVFVEDSIQRTPRLGTNGMPPLLEPEFLPRKPPVRSFVVASPLIPIH